MKPPKTFDLDYLLELDNEDQLYDQISGQFNEISTGFWGAANLELLDHLHVTEHCRVLDLACGTGHLAIEIAKRAKKGKVVGIDLSSLMLSQGREDAKKAGIENIAFVERDIHHVLPEFKSGDFDIGISCFAISYLGCDFLLKEFRQILGEKGQVGFTTSSSNSLVEWQPYFLKFIMEHTEMAASFDIQEMPDVPSNAEDMILRMEKAGFRNPRVKAIQIPLVFENAREAASFLICSTWASNYFFRIKDKTVRRYIAQWAMNKVGEHHKKDPHISSSIEFLVAWNEPER